ncbi:ribonuclease T2 [Cavenderia fasciculata]|uniref:Ribonuclease T2 n=1 Tax=Cavenderia fasciculata TaxID=261658 RepID=F4PWF6_CACFS|nr:ribonuclease T2 [Cavenderia fasciculata]EGG20320.1 ribonuclease T2 [Cavenderia fasciculata]|eukprot:XP_004367303.1 ribonuclease T2 [Cavenderia fasciculata]
MKFKLLTLFIVVLLLASNCCGSHHGKGSKRKAEPGEFDFYLFVTQWIYSYCTQGQKCLPSKIRSAFTIHGLWPNNNNGTYPSFCKGASYSSSAIQDILVELDQDWPSLFALNNNDFWDHEWTKHGTCSVVGPITDQYDYFAASIKTLYNHNITLALEESNIYPSDTQPVNIQSFSDAIQHSFNAKPLVQCYKENISQVALCMDKDLNLIDCPPAKGFTCQSSSAYWPSTLHK